jgi:hypothetical protein
MCDQMKGLVKNIYLGWKIKKDMCEGQMGHDYTFGLQRRAKVHWSTNTSWSFIGEIDSEGSITEERAL